MAEALSGVYTDLPIDFPGGSDDKASASNAGDLGSSLGREDLLEKEMATHFQYSCLENTMDGGTW